MKAYLRAARPYDIWFDGFTPSYAGALWIGTDENVDMNTTSTPAARLWGNIMNQIPAAKEGEYKEQPSNVIYTSGCYFTEGTETGLAYWSGSEERKKAEEAKKKAREEARKKAYTSWLKEREKHKRKVIDVPAHDEDVYETQRVKVRDEWVEPEKTVHHDEDNPATPDIDESQTGGWDEVIPAVTHPAEYIDQQVKVGTKHVEEQSHWEYEPGYRDGDFKFDG